MNAHDKARAELAEEFGFVGKSHAASGQDVFDDLTKAANAADAGKWFTTEAEGEAGKVNKAMPMGNDAEDDAGEPGAEDEQEQEPGPVDGAEPAPQPTMKSNSGSVGKLEEVLKSNLSDETLRLYDGEALMKDLTKGFITLLGGTNAEVGEVKNVLKGVLESQTLIMRGLVAQRKQNTELIKALENVVVLKAGDGIRASGAAALAGLEDVPVTKAWADTDDKGNESLNYDRLFMVIKKAIDKDDSLKTPGEKLLDYEHLAVRKGNYKRLPKLYREEIGLPLD